MVCRPATCPAYTLWCPITNQRWRRENMPPWNIETAEVHRSFIRQVSTTNCRTVKVRGRGDIGDVATTPNAQRLRTLAGCISVAVPHCSTRYDVPNVP